MTTMPNNNDISDQIVRFALDTQPQDLPSSALQVLRLSLADWITVALAGVDESVAKTTRALIEREGGNEESYALGLSARVPARAAALVNGATSHALDYDDTHFASLGHPSVAVLPAVLAVADITNASNDQLKQAALIGMEIAIRIGMWLGRDHYRVGFHITPTAGTFGATMAAARMLGLNPEQTHHALSLAASRASGVKAQFGSMGKPMHAGFAASNGVESALLAQLGFVAGTAALESSQGFAATHHGESDTSAFEDLGKRFVFEEVSYKFHACCHGTHAAMEALLSARDQHELDASAIKSIEIAVHPQYLDICNIASPVSGLQSKFSYKMVAALVMSRFDTTRLETFSDSICQDNNLQKLRDRVEVEFSADIAETSAEVTVQLMDGNKFHETHDLLKPVEIPELETRLRAKSKSILGSKQASALWDQVAHGDTSPTQWMSNHLDSLAAK